MGISRKDLGKELWALQKVEYISSSSHAEWVSKEKSKMMKGETGPQKKLRLLLSERFGQRYRIRPVHNLYDSDGRCALFRNFIGGKRLIVEVASGVTNRKRSVLSSNHYCYIFIKPNVLNDPDKLEEKMAEIRLYIENPKKYTDDVVNSGSHSLKGTKSSQPEQSDKKKFSIDSMRKNGRSCDNCCLCIGKNGRSGICRGLKREVQLTSICINHMKK